MITRKSTLTDTLDAGRREEKSSGVGIHPQILHMASKRTTSDENVGVKRMKRSDEARAPASHEARARSSDEERLRAMLLEICQARGEYKTC